MLTIDRLHVTYSLPHGLPNASSLQTRLDRIARERLPSTAGAQLDSALAGGDAVYRIRHLELDLYLDSSSLNETEIAERWASLMIRAVHHALSTGSSASMVARYDSHAHYIAAFFSDLIAGRAWSRWMFDEFQPLRDVPPGTIVALILGARPALIVPVAAVLRRRGELEGLLRELSETDVEVIWQRGFGFDDQQPALDWRLPDALARSAGAITWARGSPGDRARNALRLYLAVVLDTPSLAGDAALGSACHHLSLLHELSPVLNAADFGSALEEPSTTIPPGVASVLGNADPTAVAWLKLALATAAGRAYVARLSRLVRSPATPSDAPSSTQRSAARYYSCEYAGLALLLPAIRDLGLLEAVGTPGIYQILLSLVGTAHEAAARLDPAIAAMSGIAEGDMASARDQAIAWPENGERDEAGGIADPSGFFSSAPQARVAVLVIRHFTSRLRGFEESSPEYIAAQFLRLAGSIRVSTDTIEVSLSRVPLGIVLRMAGRDGDQGPIPWLAGRRLWIDLADG